MDDTLANECPKDDIPEEKIGETLDVEKDVETNAMNNDGILENISDTTAEGVNEGVSANGENADKGEESLVNSNNEVVIEEDATVVIPTTVEVVVSEEQLPNETFVVESSSEILPFEEVPANDQVTNVESVECAETIEVEAIGTELSEVTSEIAEDAVVVSEETLVDIPPELVDNTPLENDESIVVETIESVTNEIMDTGASEVIETITSEVAVEEVNSQDVQLEVTEPIQPPATKGNKETKVKLKHYEPSRPTVRKNTSPGPVPLMTESILSALSEIHGEKGINIANGVTGQTAYVERIPDTLEKAVNEKIKSKRNVIRSIVTRRAPALNDKQLLAILQDGSEPSPPTLLPTKVQVVKKKRIRSLDTYVERQLALKQLRDLPRINKKRAKKSIVERIEDVKIPKVIKTKNVSPSKEQPAPVVTSTPSRTDISSIISDWTDDELVPSTPDVSSQHNETIESYMNTTTPSVSEVNVSTSVNADDSANASLTTNGESFAKPKRVSRIIKKKIIYDPDNPETFKFASNIVQAAIASAEIKQAENKQHKAQVAAAENKQNKSTHETSQPKTPGSVEGKQMKSASPESKQNKSPNDSKTKLATKRRLTEVDKLLMDEGAVNMLYQMEQSNMEAEEVPQEQKRKKKSSSISNEKKIKLIKKAVINQSKTSLDQPVKVFRVRKEKTDATNSNNNSKIAVNAAARASMQSPSLSEMSAVSVNESRIIRRHSSSSFSSGCLSPRPQSPAGEVGNKSLNSTTDSGIHNKTGKRRGPRQKKASKIAAEKTENSFVSPVAPVPNVAALQMKSFTQLTMDVSDNITHIIVNPTGNSEELYDYQVITELTAAVRLCTNGNAVLLSSCQGSLCGGLDLRGLLQPTVEKQRHYAEQLLDAFRELMVALCECRSALVCCVGNACTGPGVALLTLCDLALASDRATFCVAPRIRRKLPPEGAALLTRPYSLPLQIGRELVLCGRKLTASEALQRGIVSRTLWPDRFIEEVRSIVGDLLQYPGESFSIMKNILRRGEVTAVTSALRHEGRLLLDYWCTPAGQDAIREVHAHL